MCVCVCVTWMNPRLSQIACSLLFSVIVYLVSSSWWFILITSHEIKLQLASAIILMCCWFLLPVCFSPRTFSSLSFAFHYVVSRAFSNCHQCQTHISLLHKPIGIKQSMMQNKQFEGVTLSSRKLWWPFCCTWLQIKQPLSRILLCNDEFGVIIYR